MGDIRFSCPECASKLMIDSESADLLVNCPVCGKAIRAWGARLLDIKFACSSCGIKLVIDVRAAGRFVNCPGCHARLEVPQPSAPPLDPARQPPATEPRAATAGLRPVILTKAEIAFLTAENSGAATPKLQPQVQGA